MTDSRIDRTLTWITPILVAVVLIVSLALLVLTQRAIHQQAIEAEARTKVLTELVLDGRASWGPSLERIEEMVADHIAETQTNDEERDDRE